VPKAADETTHAVITTTHSGEASTSAPGSSTTHSGSAPTTSAPGVTTTHSAPATTTVPATSEFTVISLLNLICEFFVLG